MEILIFKMLYILSFLFGELVRFGSGELSMVVVKRIVDQTANYICSAVPLKENAILTTCSCVTAAVADMQTGDIALFPHRAKELLVDVASSQEDLDDMKDRKPIRVSYMNIHPKCDATYEYDAAVLHLIKPLDSRINIPNIVTEKDGEAMTKSSKKCQTSALGVTSLHDGTEAQKSYDKISVKFVNINKCYGLVCVPDKNVMCEEDLTSMACLKATDGSPICKTDMGAPVFCNSMLVGITAQSRIMDMNCEQPDMKRKTLVFPLHKSLEFIQNALSAPKPKNPKVDWKLKPGERTIMKNSDSSAKVNHDKSTGTDLQKARSGTTSISVDFLLLLIAVITN